MKTFIALFSLAFSLSSFAMVELPLKTIDEAHLYEVDQTRLSYSVYGGAVVEFVTEFKVPGHPEMNIHSYLISKDLVSLEDGEFIARYEGAEAVCAYIENNKVYETGDCEFIVQVKDNKILTSLAFHE